ncbi:hypothetical protein Droror1_Dr00011447 [Drosera rotundifolia]
MLGSEQNRFPQQERRKKWRGCWGALSCFGRQKGGGKRIVPASRAPDSNSPGSASNRPQAAGIANQASTIAPSLLAPPSSPASFTNSALPSTAQSPNCFLSVSANSPGGPSSSMFATGPYAHELQLVSPPVFSTFTTEPSTAPLTPPPELAHLTTPSSPDVPFARFLSSSLDLKCSGRKRYANSSGQRSSYLPSPESPASSLISPASRTSGDCITSSFGERDFPMVWDPSIDSRTSRYPLPEPGWLTTRAPMSHDSNFFCPATFAQFYLDQPGPHSLGRLSISRESDNGPSGGNAHQSWQSKTCKQEVEELEAYRASFGFSADEMITTAQYVEISDIPDESFTIMPQNSAKLMTEESPYSARGQGGQRLGMLGMNSLDTDMSAKPLLDSRDKGASHSLMFSCNQMEGIKIQEQSGDLSSQSTPRALGVDILTDDEVIFSKMRISKTKKKHPIGSSCSDAEIDYRRARSLRG